MYLDILTASDTCLLCGFYNHTTHTILLTTFQYHFVFRNVPLHSWSVCIYGVFPCGIFVSKVNIWNVNCAIRATIETPISYPMLRHLPLRHPFPILSTGSCGIGIFVYNVNIWNAKIFDFQLINGCSWKNVEVCVRERNASTQRKLQPPIFGLCRMLYHLRYRKHTFTTVFHVLEH